MRFMLFALMVIFTITARSQAVYPKGYFRNPLNIPMSLAGNFGELRPNHYHMGVDIKTNQRENLPVFAAADGYISRVKIEPGGFGRAIYITHPNGYTTLYAHLNNFFPALETFVKKQQYVIESWKLQLDIPAILFPVKKGDLVAYSGNTGGSQGPHLHFEIRSTAEDININPLLFGLPLKDDVKPRILRFGIYDRTRSVYEQTPKMIPVKQVSSSAYRTTPGFISVPYPVISFAIGATDSHSGSTNPNGIYEAVLSVDNEQQETFSIEKVSYAATRYMNAHIDYRYKALGGPYLQHLSELPGYIESIYLNGDGHGVIDISDGRAYDISVVVGDVNGNTVELTTQVQYNNKPLDRVDPTGKIFYPMMLDGFETENCEFYIGEKCLYDSVHISHSSTVSGDPSVISDVHTIGAGYIPLQDSILVLINAQTLFSEDARLRTVMQWRSGSKSAVQKVQWQHQWAFARFRDFGSFQLVVDTDPPQIIPVGFKDGANLSKAIRLAFTVKDNLPTVKNIRTELDGKWLRFTNDKGKTYIYQFDERCKAGPHKLSVYAEDEAGNRNVQTFNFIR